MICRISSPQFNGAVQVRRLHPKAKELTCLEASATLRFVRGWNFSRLRAYCKRKGWLIVPVAALLAGCGQAPTPVPAHPLTPAEADLRRSEACAFRNVQSRTHQNALTACARAPTAIERSECGDREDAEWAKIADRVAVAHKVCELQ